MFSCTKEYNTIGTDILKSDTFQTNVELVPINVVQKAIPPFKSNALNNEIHSRLGWHFSVACRSPNY